MIVVIQCAAKKRPDAGHLMTCSRKPVEFVASPKLAPNTGKFEYARPDDLREDGIPWRKVLQAYNQNPGTNALRLCRAFELYENETYRRLVEFVSVEKLYILSAGWGLIRSDFLTPHYDITFSFGANVPLYKRRHQKDHYEDCRMIPQDTREDIVFFGGLAYLPLFCSVTQAIRSRKIVFFNSKNPPLAGACGYEFIHFENATRSTNWHYDCANAFINGTILI
jgi:hypothetical protein